MSRQGLGFRVQGLRMFKVYIGFRVDDLFEALDLLLLRVSRAIHWGEPLYLLFHTSLSESLGVVEL